MVRGWDRLSGGKRRALLPQIFVPYRCKLQDLGLEGGTGARVRKNESNGTTTAALDEDIKTAALLKSSSHASWSSILPRFTTVHARAEAKLRPTLKPAEVSSDSRQLLQRTFQIQLMWTSLARAARKAGTGKTWWQERQERRQRSKPESESQCQQGSCLLALVEERQLEHGMFVAPKEPVWLWRPTNGRQLKTKERHGQNERALWSKETKLQLWNNSHNRLSRALQTWRRLKKLGVHRTWTYDTGAAISAFPLDAMIGTETDANEMWLQNCFWGIHPPPWRLVCVQGTTDDGYGVRNTLISARTVHSKGHVAVVDSNGGYIISHNSTLTRKIKPFVQQEIIHESGAVRLYLGNGTCVGYTRIEQHVRTRHNMRDNSGSAFGTGV